MARIWMDGGEKRPSGGGAPLSGANKRAGILAWARRRLAGKLAFCQREEV
ncbi:MAG: hypothetical protein HYV54_00110 [Parcubacteria group bacterium]|nr:hypothetical protein [Parcubacteria group bacterium]